MTMLSDMFRLSPFVNNVLITLLTLVYIIVVMEIASFIRERLKMPEASRKTIHIAASSWLLFWPLFDTSHWSWRFNVAIPAVYIVKLLYLVSVLVQGSACIRCWEPRHPLDTILNPYHYTLGAHCKRPRK